MHFAVLIAIAWFVGSHALSGFPYGKDFRYDEASYTGKGFKGKFKAQMKKADASGAKLALILGEDEVVSGKVGVKMLRAQGDQQQIEQENLGSWCQDYFEKEKDVG